MIGQDKVKHFGACGAIAAIVGTAAGAIWFPGAGAAAGFLAAVVAGVAKETRDIRGQGCPEIGDMLANLAGAIAGAGGAFFLTGGGS